MLHVSSLKHHVIDVIKQPSFSLWHCRLEHMFKKGTKILSPFGYLPGFSFQDFNFVSIVFLVSRQSCIEKELIERVKDWH